MPENSPLQFYKPELKVERDSGCPRSLRIRLIRFFKKRSFKYAPNEVENFD